MRDMEDRFRDRLRREFEQRRSVNSRYSLRAFAAFLGTDHSTLSQILRSKRPLPLSRIRSWAKKLGLEPEVAAAYVAAEHLPDVHTLARDNQVRHWTAEASAIFMHPLHWQVFQLCGKRSSKTGSRQVADQCGATVDQVNIVFQRLLRLELLRTDADGRWLATTGSKVKSEREFQKMALTRVREKAAEYRVKLPPSLRA
jgi:transcriptional regulator with XRE-family HTH domain